MCEINDVWHSHVRYSKPNDPRVPGKSFRPIGSKLKTHLHSFGMTFVFFFSSSYFVLGLWKLNAHPPIHPPLWQSTVTANPAEVWDPIHTHSQEGQTPSWWELPKPCSFTKDVWKFCKYLGSRNERGIWCIAWKHKHSSFVFFSCPLPLPIFFLSQIGSSLLALLIYLWTW